MHRTVTTERSLIEERTELGIFVTMCSCKLFKLSLLLNFIFDLSIAFKLQINKL